VHVLVVDARTLFNGCDGHDRVHIALGGEFVTEPMARHYWEGTLISGAFSPRTAVRGAAQMRERVHFLGFVSEEAYGPPPMKWSDSKYGFATEEDCNGEEAQA